ncbi:MAG: UDP-N-acetylmuramoyl-L-alanyl-D-glutamate--2,6-diaminopimelate ligase [Pseudomonadota bacterium]
MTAQLSTISTWCKSLAPNGNLASDSRKIIAGDIFFAYPGDEADGRSYIADAIERGAAAIVYDGHGFDWDAAWMVPHLTVSNLKLRAGEIANTFYGQPDAAMFTVAVTGTNGKTSCTHWLGESLSRLRESTAVIGTLGVAVFKNGTGAFNANGYTTPDAVLLQRELAGLRLLGATTMAIEASSIGLDQGRLNGLHIDAALFTNLTRDHLDYHGDMTVYEAAKTALFKWPGLKHAVVNLDDPMGIRLAQLLGSSKVSVTGYTLGEVAMDGVAILRASNLHSRHGGTDFHIDSPFGHASVKSQLVGRFNVSNMLGVLGIMLHKGIAWPVAAKTLEALTAAPGRMQKIGGPDAPMIVIDYAHTPDALEKTLASLRQVADERNGKLWCVFGCGGDRDPGKRPQMGLVAEAADHVIVTSDNPRSENAHAIIEQICLGMTTVPQMIDDRAAAILSAVRHAARQDVVLLAGKGHEPYQEINGKKLPFSDADHAALALAARATMKKPS